MYNFCFDILRCLLLMLGFIVVVGIVYEVIVMEFILKFKNS